MSSEERSNWNLALEPPAVHHRPGPQYDPEPRQWQGIPGIERTRAGRLWAVWYSGGPGEGPENYVVVVRSDDDGCTWSGPTLVVDPPRPVRAFDPVLWHDPTGRLHLFWAQSYGLFDGRAGVWHVTTDEPDDDDPGWSAPERIADGVMMNKPTVLSTGEWLLPCAVWKRAPSAVGGPSVRDGERLSNVVCSADGGATWQRIGGADVPERTFDEHMIVERRDGTLWMLVRTRYGVGESLSHDRGRTWTPGAPSQIAGPDARFHIRRLRSGRLLLVNHHGFTGRSHMTALLSGDDGCSWPHRLLLDERSGVSYPDTVQADDGRIYAIYDRDRYGAREILMAVFTEEHIMRGGSAGADARLRALVNRAGE